MKEIIIFSFLIVFQLQGKSQIYSDPLMTWDNNWSKPVQVEVIEKLNSLEIIYKQTSNITLSSYPSQTPIRVYKIIYSVKDGYWHKSPPILGKIKQATKEEYIFDNKN